MGNKKGRTDSEFVLLFFAFAFISTVIDLVQYPAYCIRICAYVPGYLCIRLARMKIQFTNADTSIQPIQN